ncbi:hypothetical protein L484_008135 [Morus notabilis]|uniref:Uncharacterized protein n=1 Tax=Morus notabilis TaxID=981085 RepID=W9RY96_9ROSA|nr:hypothetical protein L484_008135 [Morus notabilis]
MYEETSKSFKMVVKMDQKSVLKGFQGCQHLEALKDFEELEEPQVSIARDYRSLKEGRERDLKRMKIMANDDDGFTPEMKEMRGIYNRQVGYDIKVAPNEVVLTVSMLQTKAAPGEATLKDERAPSEGCTDGELEIFDLESPLDFGFRSLNRMFRESCCREIPISTSAAQSSAVAGAGSRKCRKAKTKKAVAVANSQESPFQNSAQAVSEWRFYGSLRQAFSPGWAKGHSIQS